jgi:tol-pal system protein YbgF
MARTHRLDTPALHPLLHAGVLALAGLLGLASSGCSSGKSAEERQLDDLRDEITKVQATSDKFEQRLDKLEVDSADVAAGDTHATEMTRPAARTTAVPIVTPPLRVVHLGPDGLEETASPGETAGAVNDDPNDAAPRPHIRIQGTRAEAVDAPTADGADRASRSGRAAAFDPDAKRAYESALALVNAKRYPAALDALAGFLIRWPEHPNADNAMYWRGECYFAQGDWAHAAEQFDGVLARFPNGNKVGDALLKLGMSKQHLGDDAGAKAAFDRLRRDYPRSESARHIPASAGAAAPSEVKP